MRTKHDAYPVFPWISIKYLFYFLIGFVILLALVEVMFNWLAQEGQIVSNEWIKEDETIEKLNYTKLQQTNNQDPVWQTRGINPLSERMAGTRILVLGDSFVWGDGYVNANNIWWRQLERELIKRGYHDVRVIAAGLNGASTQDQLRWLKEMKLLERVRPDIVVLGYVTNDANVVDENDDPYITQPTAPNYKGSWLDSFFPLLNRQLVNKRHKKRQNNEPAKFSYETWGLKIVEASYFTSYQSWELKILEEPNMTHYKEVVRKLAEFAKETALPWLVITLPNIPHKEYFQPRYTPVAPLFQANGLTFVNILNDFVTEYSEENRSVLGDLLKSKVGLWAINPANGHPGTISTRFYARKTVDILEQTVPELLTRADDPSIRYTPEINDWLPYSLNPEKLSSSSWRFTYPDQTDMMLSMPLHEKHVVLSFELPVAIQSLSLRGEILNSARLWVNSVDPDTGIARRDNIDIGTQHGNQAHWDLNDLPQSTAINALKFSVDITANDRYAQFIKCDNTDLSGNGRHYDFRNPSTSGRELVLTINFNEVSVRP